MTRQVDAKGAGVSQEMAYYVACIAADRGRKDEAAEMIRRGFADNSQNLSKRQGGMEAEMVSLIAKLYPDPKQERLKPGDMVIVVVRAAHWNDNDWIPFPCGTRLKVVSVPDGGDRLGVQYDKGMPGWVHRKDVAKLPW